MDFAVDRRLVVAVHGGDGEGFEFDDDLRRASGAGSSGGASSEGNCEVLVQRNKWGIRGVDAGTLQREVRERGALRFQHKGYPRIRSDREIVRYVGARTFFVVSFRVDVPTSGLIHFDVGVADKQLSLSLFEDPPDCNPEVRLSSFNLLTPFFHLGI